MFTTNVSSIEGGFMCVRKHADIMGSSQIQPPWEAKLRHLKMLISSSNSDGNRL